MGSKNTTFDFNNRDGAYEIVLKLPSSGMRQRNDGAFYSVDHIGYYWSSTKNDSTTKSDHIEFNSTTITVQEEIRAHGDVIRVICYK